MHSGSYLNSASSYVRVPIGNTKEVHCHFLSCQLGRRDIQALLIRCTNAGCGETMERQQHSEHVRTRCLHTPTPCKYKGIGCDTELKRGDLIIHEQDDKLHLHRALDTINLLLGTVGSLQGTIDSLRVTVSSQQDTISSLQDKINLLQGTINSLQDPTVEERNQYRYAIVIGLLAIWLGIWIAIWLNTG